MDFDLSIAVSLCQRFEGFRGSPYLCPAGIPTIGFGSTQYTNGKRVTLQDPPMTRAEAQALLEYELRHTYLPGALRHCPGLITDPRRLNALVDFCYNLGVGKLQTSTLKKKVNEQNWEAAKVELMKWCKGGGKVLPGLLKRRQAEADLL